MNTITKKGRKQSINSKMEDYINAVPSSLKERLNESEYYRNHPNPNSLAILGQLYSYAKTDKVELVALADSKIRDEVLSKKLNHTNITNCILPLVEANLVAKVNGDEFEDGTTRYRILFFKEIHKDETPKVGEPQQEQRSLSKPTDMVELKEILKELQSLRERVESQDKEIKTLREEIGSLKQHSSTEEISSREQALNKAFRIEEESEEEETPVKENITGKSPMMLLEAIKESPDSDTKDTNEKNLINAIDSMAQEDIEVMRNLIEECNWGIGAIGLGIIRRKLA